VTPIPAGRFRGFDFSQEAIRAPAGVCFFEGLLAREAARVHAVQGDHVAALGLFDRAIESFQQTGNISQLIITVALVPQLFEELGRLESAATVYAAITQESASLAHVHELAAVGERLEVALGPDTWARCAAAGSQLDLNAAASYARDHIAASRAELDRAGTDELPGGLSRREVEVLRLVADGLTTRSIADRLFISAKTADHHIQHIYTKTGVSTRAAATRWAVDHAVVSINTR
jgi:DNA-binding NarL/FixJ family response regulator